MRNGSNLVGSSQFVLGVAAAALLTLPPSSAPKPQQFVQSGNMEAAIVVNFSFNVRDNQERVVQDLSPNQMHVFVAGKEQKIESLTRVPPSPISIVFLVDQSGSRMGGSHQNIYPELQPALDCFRPLLATGASVLVAGFNDEPMPEGGFATTAQDLFASMQVLDHRRPRGSTALFDSIAWASQQFGQRPGYRAIIVSTDGDDNMSRIKAEAFVPQVQAAKASLYFVNLAHLEHDTPQRFVRRDTNILIDTAKSVGGESLILDNPENMKAAFNRIAEDIATSYNVTFHLDSPKRVTKIHSLKITVDGDRPKIFAPSGDYALPR